MISQIQPAKFDSDPETNLLQQFESSLDQPNFQDYLDEFEEDDEWYTAKDFVEMTKCGLHWDHGGIVSIYQNDAPTNLHAGIWMLNKEDETSEPVELESLVELDNIQILWANK